MWVELGLVGRESAPGCFESFEGGESESETSTKGKIVLPPAGPSRPSIVSPGDRSSWANSRTLPPSYLVMTGPNIAQQAWAPLGRSNIAQQAWAPLGRSPD